MTSFTLEHRVHLPTDNDRFGSPFTGADLEHTSHFSTSLLALDALLRSPVSGHRRAFTTRKQLAYCQNFNAGATDVFAYEADVRYRRDSRGHLTRKANSLAFALFDECAA